VAFQGFRRKSLDAKDGVTAFLQNCLYIRKGERKGERLGGDCGPSNNDVFGGYAGYSDVDPTAEAAQGVNLQGEANGSDAEMLDEVAHFLRSLEGSEAGDWMKDGAIAFIADWNQATSGIVQRSDCYFRRA
jgi:hypothetical protein